MIGCDDMKRDEKEEICETHDKVCIATNFQSNQILKLFTNNQLKCEALRNFFSNKSL
jgi:hypothetical protein